MKTTLIILRGNSGSGKTTLAHALRQRLPHPTIIISQDVVRREMLAVPDTPANLAIPFLQELVTFSNEKAPVVILEGILAKERYAAMLRSLVPQFDHALIYYYDLPFATTLARHQTKPQAAEYGAATLRRWWLPHDTLNLPQEKRLTADLDLITAQNLILNDYRQLSV